MHSSHLGEIERLKELLQEKENEKASKEEELKQIQEQLEKSDQACQDIQNDFAEVFKKKKAEWKENTAKIKSDFRLLLEEHTALQAKYDEETEQKTAQIAELEKRIASVEQEKLGLTQSLDLTKINTEGDTSKIVEEKNLIIEE